MSISVANSLWGNKTGHFLDPAFMRITQTQYQGDFQFLDFVSDAEGARQTINSWVEGKTKNKITDLIPMGLIGKSIRLLLVNAIYFKGDWSVPFPKAASRPEDFTDSGGSTAKVPMMNHTFIANYTENADYQLAQFTYKENAVSMVVILPKKKDGLPAVEMSLSANTLAQSLALVSAARLQVALPRFKITEEFNLGGELAKLGMKEAFLAGSADFSGMENKRRSKSSLSISEVVHKAFVDVDEQGTEAAAGTGVRVTFQNRPSPPIPFRADHPFLFLLRDNSTGSILFIGRLCDAPNK